MAIEIVSFPIKKRDFPLLAMLNPLPEGKHQFFHGFPMGFPVIFPFSYG